jgi:hypothetical protein
VIYCLFLAPGSLFSLLFFHALYFNLLLLSCLNVPNLPSLKFMWAEGFLEDLSLEIRISCERVGDQKIEGKD